MAFPVALAVDLAWGWETVTIANERPNEHGQKLSSRSQKKEELTAAFLASESQSPAAFPMDIICSSNPSRISLVVADPTPEMV